MIFCRPTPLVTRSGPKESTKNSALFRKSYCAEINPPAKRGLRLSFLRRCRRGAGLLYCIVTGTWYNARGSKSLCEYRNGAVTFYFAELERARDQKDQKGVAL